MPLVDRYLAREILLPFAAAVVFLSQLLLATQLLSEAEVLLGSGVSAWDLASVIVALVPHLLGFVLPIAFLLGAVVGVGRLSEDREVVALSAAGVSPARLVRVPLAIAVVTAALGVWLALAVEPAAFSLARERVTEIVKRNLTNDVRPGTFYDQIPGFTLYAERVKEGRWENVLISDHSMPSAPVLAFASTGALEPVGLGEEMRLVLGGGELHREDPVQGDYAAAEFRRGELVVGLGTALLDRNGLARSDREASFAATRERIRRAREQGNVEEAWRQEGFLHRRIAQALAVIPFALLAVPLGASRRVGRAFAVSATLLAVVAHYVLLRGGEELAWRGALPAWFSLELPTLILSAVALVMVALQARRGVGAVR